jgi:hypothetical protein
VLPTLAGALMLMAAVLIPKTALRSTQREAPDEVAAVLGPPVAMH